MSCGELAYSETVRAWKLLWSSYSSYCNDDRWEGRGQWERQKQEEATGESSWVNGQFSTAPCHPHEPGGETETEWERQTGDWETLAARSLTELRLMDCYVKHNLTEKADTRAHAYRHTPLSADIHRQPINQSNSWVNGECLISSCHSCNSQEGLQSVSKHRNRPEMEELRREITKLAPLGEIWFTKMENIM